jgi:hypothetical protein
MASPRNNPSQLFQIASFLPPSIQSLHLLDYWGASMEDHLFRYSIFPDKKLPGEFLRLVLESLLQNCASMGLTSLREVKLSSREYAEDYSF